MPTILVLAIVVVLVVLSLRVVKEYDRGVIFFLGKYTGVRGPGLIVLIPVFEQMTRVTLRTITLNIPSQKIITKDNVSIDIAAVALLPHRRSDEIGNRDLPENMQRAMAKEAEPERERRAKTVAAEGEFQAAVKLGEAADIISQHPVALQLRTLQTMAESSIEKNSTIIFPAQFMTTVQEAIKMIRGDGTA
jgi:regulator of protease activity HflC (stomatin/prohibitin superfamily)